MPLAIDISTPNQEGAMQVSKASKLPILLDGDEMEALFMFLKTPFLFDVTRPVLEDEAKIEVGDFLACYSTYIEGIKKGELVDEKRLQPYFSLALSLSLDSYYAMPLTSGKYLIKARRPIIQLKRHHFIFSDTFHFGVMGSESISWGIEFSYPQLFLDPKTQQIGKVDKSALFPNTVLFHQLREWVRGHTTPTPFIVSGKRSYQPIRLGKRCFSWINSHPGLLRKGLQVS